MRVVFDAAEERHDAGLLASFCEAHRPPNVPSGCLRCLGEREGQERDGALTLTPLQAEALHKVAKALLGGDLEGAENYCNHVALYPIFRREDDLSQFILALHAYVKKLISTFRCGGC
jgi:hypothetical protein